MSHPRRPPYSRFARLLKARVREALAPRISDWDLDRPRLGHTPPLCSGVHVSPINRPRAADTAGGMAQGK